MTDTTAILDELQAICEAAAGCLPTFAENCAAHDRLVDAAHTALPALIEALRRALGRPHDECNVDYCFRCHNRKDDCNCGDYNPGSCNCGLDKHNAHILEPLNNLITGDQP